jgi:hypothetical protein
LDSILLEASKELIDDAKAKCADLVFKEVCLEILARSRQVLKDEDFELLVDYASRRMQEEALVSVDVIK